MHATAILISIFVSILIMMFLPLFLLGKGWTAAQERDRERRLADARMNARLLRFDI